MLKPQDKQVLTDIKIALEILNISMIVVGAGARLLIFDRKYNLNGRSTKDWDIAIKIASWSEYEKLRKYLTEGKNARFQTTNILHKFIHIETELEIDIVPFGEIGTADQIIQWPDDTIMTVMGLEEALLRAEIITIDNCQIPALNTPSLVVLKLFAWDDRQADKDVQDIDFILKNYEDDERVYEELATKLAAGNLQYLDANIYLLGCDIRRMFRDETIAKLNEVLARLLRNVDETDIDSPLQRLKILDRAINAQER